MGVDGVWWEWMKSFTMGVVVDVTGSYCFRAQGNAARIMGHEIFVLSRSVDYVRLVPGDGICVR